MPPTGEGGQIVMIFTVADADITGDFGGFTAGMPNPGPGSRPTGEFR